MAGPEDPSALTELVAIMRRLRVECGWKAAQTHRTLARHLLEETYETLEAIEELETGDPEEARAHLCEELGDVLLQVYFHAAVAEQEGWFDVEDVAAGLREKLLRRNPHVFGDVQETDPVRINETWEALKAAEKRREGLMDGVPLALPALTRATKLLDRLDRAGHGAEAPAAASGAHDDPATEVGDALLALVARARRDDVDPEQALRDAVRRAEARARP